MDYLYGLAGATLSDEDKKRLQDIKDAVAKAIADVKAGTVTVPESK